MRIVLAANTLRGLAVAQRLRERMPAEGSLALITSAESPPEPAFVEPMRQYARQNGVEFDLGQRLEELPAFAGEPVDLLLMVNWRRLVRREALDRPTLGAYLIHDSLLPSYRGFSPTVWAMVNGESRTGATLLQAADQVDAGDIVDQQAVEIGADDTIAVVTDRVTQAYLALLDRNLASLIAGTARATPQDHSRATYACKRLPEDSVIDWSAPANQIYNLVRAVTRPYAGARTTHGGVPLTIWASRRRAVERIYSGAVPGRVVGAGDDGSVTVLTGQGELDILEVELPGGGAQPAAQVISTVSATLGR